MDAEYLQLFGGDLDRLTPEQLGFVARVGERAFMRLEDGRCAALVADVEAREFRCGIYEARPDVCRALERGSSGCKFEYDRKASAPDVLLERLQRRG